MECLSCSRSGLSWGREPVEAIYTMRQGAAVPLCATCLSIWLRNAAGDLTLAPRKIEYLEM